MPKYLWWFGIHLHQEVSGRFIDITGITDGGGDSGGGDTINFDTFLFHTTGTCDQITSGDLEWLRRL